MKRTDDPCCMVATKGEYLVQMSDNSLAGLIREAEFECETLLRARSSNKGSFPST
jgi:hypothetical protein